MKNLYKILIFLSFLFNSYHLYSQASLGQTKAYIIEQNKMCRIDANWEGMIIFNCDKQIRYYLFDEESKLCVLHGFNLTKSYKETYIEELKRNGYVFKELEKVPTLVKSGDTDSTSSWSMKYENEHFKINVLESDSDGDGNSERFGVLVQYRD